MSIMCFSLGSRTADWGRCSLFPYLDRSLCTPEVRLSIIVAVEFLLEFRHLRVQSTYTRQDTLELIMILDLGELDGNLSGLLRNFFWYCQGLLDITVVSSWSVDSPSMPVALFTPVCIIYTVGMHRCSIDKAEITSGMYVTVLSSQKMSGLCISRVVVFGNCVDGVHELTWADCVALW